MANRKEVSLKDCGAGGNGEDLYLELSFHLEVCASAVTGAHTCSNRQAECKAEIKMKEITEYTKHSA